MGEEVERITDMKKYKKPLIGFIGQGFVGKSYADDFELRGHKVVRYSLEEPYRANKKRIKDCDIVFIAVPTPTVLSEARANGGRPQTRFDCSIVEEALTLVGVGKTAVIKSTILPGTTRQLQKKFPKLFVMHSPEFLVLKNASEDAARPLRNIIGIPKKTAAFISRAKTVLQMLPKAPYESICIAEEAELVKYAGNFFLYLKVLFANSIYDTAAAVGANYEVVRASIAADPRIGSSHLQVLHDSGHRGAKRGRGAGGVCFIKDIAAFADLYERSVHDPWGSTFIRATIEKNIDLLMRSGKDLDLLLGVHGASALARHKKR